jgi:hypothetical protein
MNGMAMMTKKMMKMSMLGLKNSFQWTTLTSNALLLLLPVIATLSIPWRHLIGIGPVFIRIFFFQI